MRYIPFRGKRSFPPNFINIFGKILVLWVLLIKYDSRQSGFYGTGVYGLSTIEKEDFKKAAKNIELSAKKTANGLGMAKDVFMNMYEFSKNMNETINNYQRNKFDIENEVEKKYGGGKDENEEEKEKKDSFKDKASEAITKRIHTVNKLIKDKVLGDETDSESESETENEFENEGLGYKSYHEQREANQNGLKASVVRKDPLAKNWQKVKAKVLRRKLYKYYTFGNQNVKEENYKQLDNSIGYDNFLKPFIASLKPEFKQLLRGQPIEYVKTYYTISQRLLALTSPILRSVTNFDGSTTTSEVVNFEHELYSSFKPSFLQIFENPEHTLKVTTNEDTNVNKTVDPEFQKALDEKFQDALNGRALTENERKQLKSEEQKKRVRLRSWEVDSKIQTTTLLKTLYLLVSDVRTRDPTDRLENLAKALGYNLVKNKRESRSSGAPLANNLGADMFWASGNNPFILGHLATMMLSYTEYESFFSQNPRRRFYSWLELVRSGPGGCINRLDYMCGIRRGSRYSRGSNGLVHKKTSTAKKYESNVSSDGVFLCEMLEVLLRSINLTMDSMGDLLNQKGSTYEPNVGSVINGKRMQAKLCSDPKEATISVRCDFEHSVLVRDSTYRGVPESEATDLRKRLSEAFDVFLMMSDINSVNEVPNSWFRILADPRRFKSFLEMTLMWDPRMFTGSKKKTWMADYNKLEKKRIKRNLTAEVVPAYNAVQYFLKLPQEFGTKKKKQAKVRKHRAEQRFFIYMASSGVKKWIETNMTLMHQTYNYSPSVLLGGSIANRFRDFYDSSSIGLAHLFLYNLLSKKFPSGSYLKELVKLQGADPFSRFVDATSIFAPAKLKKVVKWFLKGHFVKKFLQEKTKLTLKQLLRGDVLRDALESITFVTHSMANIQVIQNAEFWGRSFNNPNRPSPYFLKGGVVRLIDNTIREWSDKGYTQSIAEKLKNHVQLNENDLKIADFHHQHSTESIKWDKNLNQEILKAYNEFLDFPSIKMLEARGHMLYEVVKDSRDNLEQNLENTIFFGRILTTPELKSKLKKFFRTAKNFGNFVMNKYQRNVDNAIWFGIKLDLDKVMHVVNELHKLQRKLSSNESWNLQGAFIDVIEDLVEVLTNQTSRIPVDVKDNYGMPTLSNIYGRMSVDERRVEFQQSMCSEHCGAIWKAILAFTMSTLRNPGSIKSYEKNLSNTTSLSELNSPNYVNSVRFILKGDAWSGFYETLLPKSMKKELEVMEYGKSFYIANVLKMASLLMNRMGFVYTATTLKVQAPYFGNFTTEWMKERKKNRNKALFSALALGTMATYTVLECMDIAQHAVEMGSPPTETCWFLVKPPSMHCAIEPVSNFALSAASVALRDVFSSTILALTGPYMMIPMGVYGTWSLLKRQFKILHRLDMAMSSVFSRLWKRVNTKGMIRSVTRLFRNRDRYRKEIEAAAVEEKQTGNEEIKNVGGFADEGNSFSYTHMD